MKKNKAKKNKKLNIYIPNLKEKELLIAHYFCEKSKKDVTLEEVFDMWCNWFKNDFRINNQPTFCVRNGMLEYRSNVKKKDMNILKQYDKAIKLIYKWIKRAVDIPEHNKMYFKRQLDDERKREFSRILPLARRMGFYLTLSEKDLYKNKLGHFHLVKDTRTIISGDCDKVIDYLEKMKRESA